MLGASLTITGAFGGLLDDRLRATGYASAGLRAAGIALGGVGGALLGYGLALRPPGELARRVAVAPSIGRASVGVTLTIRATR